MIYRQPMMIISFLIGLGYIISFILFSIDSSIIKLTNPIVNILTGIAFAFLLPLSVIFHTKKLYRTDKRYKESVDWTISENKLKRKSNSFETEFNWTSILNIKKFNNWIIITYKDNVAPNAIPKKSFKTDYDYELFWEYADKNKVPIK